MTRKPPAKAGKSKVFALTDSDIVSTPSAGTGTSARGTDADQAAKATDRDSPSDKDKRQPSQASKRQPGNDTDRA